MGKTSELYDKKNRESKYICNDCVFAFELLSHFGKDIRRKYCPKCGDYMAVVPLKIQKTRTDIWTDEEIEDLDKLIRGEVAVYTLSLKLGRGIKAINERKTRRKKELGILGERAKGWTDEELSNLDKFIKGELTMEQAERKIKDRTRKAIELRRLRRLKEFENDLKKQNQGVII